MSVGIAMFSPSRSDADYRRTIIHEGIHTVAGEEATIHIPHRTFKWNHTREYDKAAGELDE
jgi:hypothetical protein